MWYDIQNAFPSVNLTHLFTVLKASNIPEEFIDVIRDVYDELFTQFKTKLGCTLQVPNQTGTKQACPLSPILFLFVIEPLLRALDSIKETASIKFSPTDTKINHLAFADDIKIFTETWQGIQDLNKLAEEFCEWSLLEISVNKCAFLAITKGKEDPETRELKIQSQSISRISIHESYKYL